MRAAFLLFYSALLSQVKARENASSACEMFRLRGFCKHFRGWKVVHLTAGRAVLVFTLSYLCSRKNWSLSEAYPRSCDVLIAKVESKSWRLFVPKG